ncbi:MAG: hypothetical protein WCL16_10100 [bacterium]
MIRNWLETVAVAGFVSSAIVLTGCDNGDSGASAAPDAAPVAAPAAAVARATYSAGSATILGTFSFDYDAGSGGTTVVPAGNVADVFLRRMTAADSELQPVNGAAIGVIGVVDFNSVTYETVSGMGLGGGAVNLTSMPAGTVIGFKTDAGRFGKMRVNSYAGNHDMSMGWLTWE